MFQPGPLTTLVPEAHATGCCLLARGEITDSKEGVGKWGQVVVSNAWSLCASGMLREQGNVVPPHVRGWEEGVQRQHLAGPSGILAGYCVECWHGGQI